MMLMIQKNQTTYHKEKEKIDYNRFYASSHNPFIISLIRAQVHTYQNPKSIKKTQGFSPVQDRTKSLRCIFTLYLSERQFLTNKSSH